MKEEIKKLALANGFKLKEQKNGEMDLNPYVYKFAAALIENREEQIIEAIKRCFKNPGCTDGQQIVINADYNNLVAVINEVK